MLCRNCGQEVNNVSICPYCSEELVENATLNMIRSIDDKQSRVLDSKKQEETKEKDYTVFFIFVMLVVIGGLIVFMVLSTNKKNFYFDENVSDSNEAINEVLDNSDDKEYVAVSKTGQDGTATGVGVTKVVFDNQYLKQTILTSIDEVAFFIELDNNNNKARCSDDIRQIEDRIEENYGILAVNLCEIDLEFVQEIETIISHIYNNYPSVKGTLTNITVANVGDDVNYMAAFMPMFTFVTSNTTSTYPLGIKTQIILNAKYFLNTTRIESSVSRGTAIGYFPPNATRSSTVAHEFGHYLSYVGMLKYYKTEQLRFVRTNLASKLYDINKDFLVGDYSKMLIERAYDKYLNNYNGTLSFDEFRGTISNYAVVRDSQGLYIYDETIAEAYHDVYLNGENANLASKLIFDELLAYL